MLEFKQMSKEVSYLDLPVPLPSRPVGISRHDTLQEAAEKLDRFFDDIIKVYPDIVQEELKKTYYEDEGVIPMEYKGNTHKGRFCCKPNDEKNIISVAIEIREEIQSSLLLCRLNKIHEIAFHFGQQYTYSLNIGMEKFGCPPELKKDFRIAEETIRVFDEKLRTNPPKELLFLELSVAPVEKYLYDSIPQSLIQLDLDRIQKKTFWEKTHTAISGLPPYKSSYRCHLEIGALFVKRMSAKQCAELKHRNEGNTDIADDVKLFSSRQDIQDFKYNAEKWIKEQTKKDILDLPKHCMQKLRDCCQYIINMTRIVS